MAIASSGADAPHEPVAIGERKLFLASAQLGFDGELGVIVAASDGPDFPGQTERALLEVAANRATLSLQQAQRQLRAARRDDRPMIDAIPGAAWFTRADGSLELINQPWLDYTGLTLEQAINWGWTVALHPDEVLDVVLSLSLSELQRNRVVLCSELADGLPRVMGIESSCNR